MTTEASNILVADGLRKVFGRRGGHDVVAVDDASFSLRPGGSLAIVGESGSGKTTIARMLVGLETPTGGHVLIDGERLDGNGTKARRARARRIQMVFQDPYSSLDPRQSIGDALGEIVSVVRSVPRRSTAARVRELGHLVSLEDAQLAARPRQLSGGQRQRAAIARALAAEPAVVVLDEAVSALDVSIQAQIINLLADVRSETGVAYVLISHDLAVVRQMSDDCLVMRQGRTVEAGPVDRTLDSPVDPYTRRLRDSVPRLGWDPDSILRSR